MRRLLALATLAVSSLAHGDASLPPRPSPRSPIGARCDAALTHAQQVFDGQFTDGVHFQVEQRSIVGKFQWSDMCGVWGDYTVRLSRDLRGAQPWRWRRTRRVEETEEHGPSVRGGGTRRANGWRAEILVESDSDEHYAQEFIDAFRVAVDVCLGEAALAKGSEAR